MDQKQAIFSECGSGDTVRAPYALVDAWLKSLTPEQIALKRREAEVVFRRIGITFAVYTDGGDPERLIPFDLIPRVLAAAEWRRLEAGLVQRARALNAFIHDVYHDREIIRAGKVPEALVLRNAAFRPEMAGLTLPGRMYAHIAGIDLVRTGPDDYYVLEDNCRTPSGVSYMLENRDVMQRLFPELFECGLYDQDFTARSFYLWLLRGIIDSIIIFFTTYLVFYTDVIAGSGLNAGMWSFGA